MKKSKVNTPEGAEVRYFYDDADRLIRTEEDVQVDTLTVQDNSARIQPLDGKASIYPQTDFMCQVVTDLEFSAKGAEITILYEEDLLELTQCTPQTYGVTADTSTPGVIKLTTSQSIGRGKVYLCSLAFTAQADNTGTAYVAVAPESTLTNCTGTFLFSECTGLLMDVCLPDYNEDGITDLRDFTLLAKQYYVYVDEETEKYDITGNGLVDDKDLDYMKELLFAGITAAEPLEADRVADRTLQTAYTVKTKKETRVTTYEYNAADQVTKVIDCNGNSVYYDYDSCGRLVKMTDQVGYANEIIYDTAGNPVKVVLPEGVTESYTYDTNGSLLTVTDSLGTVTTYGYDVYGRTTSIADPVGVKTSYQYDIAGNVTKNLFTGEIYCYNAYDEVVSYTDAEGNVTKVQYDAQGNITSTTDALGNTTAYTYRKDGLLTEIKDASGAVTLYEYDSKGRAVKETDTLGAVTTYEYDGEDRVVKETAPNGTVTEYTYNTDGSVTKVTAVTLDGEKEELRYLYALDGSLTASISSSDILEYTYDERGYVETVEKNNSHKLNLVYDGNGNLTLLKELTSGKYTPDSITSYKYDTRGYLTEVSSGGTVTYKTSGYDRDGYAIFSETAEGGELLASYVTSADGLIEQVTDGAGNVTKYQYNQQKQVTELTITAADGTTLYSEANSYDKNGSLLSQNVSGAGYESEKRTYTYDALDRLLSETKNGQTTCYTYDSMGNRLTKTEDGVTTAYVYDLCNKLLSETTGSEVTAYSYDALGNLTEKVSSEGTTTYAYDALNQLTEVVNPDGTWQTNTYDASGIRSIIAENGVTTEFMTFNGLVLSGYNKNGEQTEHYYYGNSLLAAEYADVETSLYYYLKNSHGDVIGLTDSAGTLTETYRYGAFGILTSIQSMNENGVLEKTETAVSRFLYAGEQLDNTTGLYYLRARQYDTTVGRFTQEDTYLGDGRNLYVYVSNNPLKYVDPSGHEATKDLRDKMNGPYIEMSETAEKLYDPAVEQAKKDNWNRFVDGAQDVTKGILITATGAVVIYFMPAATPAWLQWATVTLGAASIGMGLSDMTEGTEDIYYGMTGDSESVAVNPVEEIFFDGEEEAYDQAEFIVSLLTTLDGIASVALAEALGITYGNISNYANILKQGKEFLETLGETVEDRNDSARGLIGHDFEDYLTRTIGGDGSFSVSGRDFDGGVGKRWWEAKSGGFWDMLLDNAKKMEKFKSDMGDRLRIATENGATYELFSNTPIPEIIKEWLTKKGIPFTEILN